MFEGQVACLEHTRLRTQHGYKQVIRSWLTGHPSSRRMPTNNNAYEQEVLGPPLSSYTVSSN